MPKTRPGVTPGDAYAGAARALHRAVRRHLARHGGDPDDLLSEAHLAFLAAYESYDWGRPACFASWLYGKVLWRLAQHRRNAAKLAARENTARPGSEALSRVPQKEQAAPCPEDAAEMIRLALPDAQGRLDPDVLINAALVRSPRSPLSVRLGVMEALESRGWSRDRVLCALELVREVL